MLDALNCVNSDLFLPRKCQNRGTNLTQVTKFRENFGFGYYSVGNVNVSPSKIARQYFDLITEVFRLACAFVPQLVFAEIRLFEKVELCHVSDWRQH